MGMRVVKARASGRERTRGLVIIVNEYRLWVKVI